VSIACLEGTCRERSYRELRRNSKELKHSPHKPVSSMRLKKVSPQDLDGVAWTDQGRIMDQETKRLVVQMMDEDDCV
jgi:hypothetical protein